jgi:hypothetical protein
VGPEPLGGPGIKPGQLGGDAGLVDEDEIVGIEGLEPLAERLPLGGDIGPVLLTRPERLLWNGPPLITPS